MWDRSPAFGGKKDENEAMAICYLQWKSRSLNFNFKSFWFLALDVAQSKAKHPSSDNGNPPTPFSIGANAQRDYTRVTARAFTVVRASHSASSSCNDNSVLPTCFARTSFESTMVPYTHSNTLTGPHATQACPLSPTRR